jgi:hypothetical protein
MEIDADQTYGRNHHCGNQRLTRLLAGETLPAMDLIGRGARNVSALSA